jgi:murein DD-endopeptidase MepM/ murein hydrolase activator NlpD
MNKSMKTVTMKNHGLWTLLLSIVLVLAVIAGVFPVRVLAAGVQVTCASYYSVVSGDTLSAIAAKYDITWQQLATANDLKDPYPIYVGQSLCIPASSTGSSSSSTSTSTATTSSARFTVTRDGNYLTIKVNNLSKKSVYYIKADDGKDRMFRWTKIGLVRMGKNTAITTTLKLPKGMRGTEIFNICLKNSNTDALYCGKFTLPPN